MCNRSEKIVRIVFRCLALFAAGVPMSAQAQKTMLKIAFPKVEFSLDPHNMEDAYSMAMNLQIHRGLMRYTPEGQPIADLATRWQEDASHLRYVFTLGKNTFSDGSPILAEHVRQSLARLFASGSSMGADMEYIKGARKFKSTKNLDDFGVKVLPNEQIEILLEHPSALLTKHLATADCAILKIAKFDESAQWNSNTASSGPYRVREVGNNQVTIEKWRVDVLDSKKPPAVVRFSFADDDALVLAERGENDSLDRFSSFEPKKALLTEKGWVESVTDIFAKVFVVLNPKDVPDDVRAYLVGRIKQDDIAKLFPGTNFKPGFGLIPNGLPGTMTKSAYEALRGSAASTPEPQTFELPLEYSEGNPVAETIARHLKTAWDTKAFKVKLIPLPRGKFLQRMFASQGSAMLGVKGMDYFDGYSILTYFRSGYDANFFHVSDPKIDAALDQASSVLDSIERTKEYQNIQRLILEKHTVIPLLFGSASAGLWSPRVKSARSHPAGLHTLPLETVEMR